MHKLEDLMKAYGFRNDADRKVIEAYLKNLNRSIEARKIKEDSTKKQKAKLPEQLEFDLSA